MKGTIFDLLRLAAEKPEIAKELGELAARHGIELSDEVTDEELEMVAGGANLAFPIEPPQGIGELQQMDLQIQQQEYARVVTTYSNILKQWQDTSNSIVNNIKG